MGANVIHKKYSSNYCQNFHGTHFVFGFVDDRRVVLCSAVSNPESFLFTLARKNKAKGESPKIILSVAKISCMFSVCILCFGFHC